MTPATYNQRKEHGVETSSWTEEVVHPRTGEKKLFRADTEDELERAIEAWQETNEDAEPSNDRATVD